MKYIFTCIFLLILTQILMVSSYAAGNIVGLNFDITQQQPSWWQVLGMDARDETGYTYQSTQYSSYYNPIPAAPVCGAYALLPSSRGDNGILFTGSTNPELGTNNGQVSPTNWQVGSTLSQLSEPYNAINANSSETSFSAVMSQLTHSGLTPTDVTTALYGTCVNMTSCTFPSNLPSGEYIIDATTGGRGGTVTFTGFTFPANSNYIILVKGKLLVKGPIIVPTSSTAFFTVSDDIMVDPSVGY